jgi:hypothetical protein
MDVTGQRSTGNILQGQRAIDVSKRIDLLEPSAQPLAIFSRKMGKERAISPEFKWLEDALKTRYDATTGAVSGTTNTQIPVVNGGNFAEHDMIQNTRTSENMLVDSVVGNTLTVKRGIGSTATAMNNADEIVLIGSAQPEGDDVKPARSNNPTLVNNYTEIFRTPWSATNTARASTYVHNPSDWRHQADKAQIEHAKDIELSFIHGRKSEDLTTFDNPIRYTGGALQFISTNQTDAGGTLSQVEFDAANRQGFRYGTKSKLLLASALVTSVLNAFPMGKLQMRNDETTYGMDVSLYQSPFGKLNLVTHWLLEGAKYGGYAIGLDMQEIAYKYLANDELNRDTTIETNRQGNGVDGRIDEVLSECGLKFGQEKRHFLISGGTG